MADSVQYVVAEGALEGDEPREVEVVGKGLGAGHLGVKRTREGPYRVVTPNPLAFEEKPVLFPDGWIAIVRGDPYRVEWLSPDGQRVRGDPLPFSTLPVSRAERCFAIDGAASGGDCREDLYPPFPTELPPFWREGAVLALSDGTVAIARTPSAAERP